LSGQPDRNAVLGVMIFVMNQIDFFWGEYLSTNQIEILFGLFWGGDYLINQIEIQNPEGGGTSTR
jgi:hypothetical protein